MIWIHIIVHAWYYQTWLFAMACVLFFVNDRIKATALYVLIGYAAVAWHPLVEEMFKWPR